MMMIMSVLHSGRSPVALVDASPRAIADVPLLLPPSIQWICLRKATGGRLASAREMFIVYLLCCGVCAFACVSAMYLSIDSVYIQEVYARSRSMYVCSLRYLHKMFSCSSQRRRRSGRRGKARKSKCPLTAALMTTALGTHVGLHHRKELSGSSSVLSARTEQAGIEG